MTQRLKITIKDGRKIFAIQKEFSEMFPYLRVDFFAKPSKPGAAASDKIIRHPSRTLGKCRTIHNTGTITITPAMTVADLENNFRNVYGLSTKILRKSGKAWLEATVTEGWTLEEQNKQGEALSK